ncbi:alkaline phosphatase D family protein [Allostreptomyces psammosilenae]|uniref:Alkaline phosphatase D n=1 Tax=Allostreptomyces psammosilenae TaxID=1892865 RepID=A0A853ACC9_9ACTN|nr:alkaline phosphatase D family protein [Allostreptomyces psammosilenae]NYI08201.1 alkaline phosphatase D [Allostreptomyces psammosilenae]
MHNDLTRRRLLGATAAGLTTIGLWAAGASASRAWAQPRFPGDPFRLGVASGDPHPDGVVLWTRLAPDPLAVDGRGGMPERKVNVGWQVARDENFRRIVRQGHTFATPELGHSVHVEVDGLEPGREYFYRFRTGGDISPVGRARTAPDPRDRVGELAFAFASCQCWYEGFYTAYRHMAAEDLDFVVHLGDYLYEYGVGATAGIRNMTLDASFQRETATLPDYRNRYALTKLDADLQAAHQAFSWILTWDDHEVENNWAADIAAIDSDGLPDTDPAWFLARKAAAFQAYYEHQPLRLPQRPHGARAQMYRRLHFGRLLDLHVLDSRSHRTDQACGDGTKPGCADRHDPSRTMLGEAQEKWLLDGAGRSAATWNVLANQTLIAAVDQNPDPEIDSSGLDMWDGYTAARDRLLTGLRDRGANNPVVLTGDIHRSVVADLKLDFADERSPVVATEFAGSSISSGKDGAAMDQLGRNWLAVNPHLRFHNAQRGYVSCRITPDAWRTDYRVVPYVTRPDAPVETAGSFVVEAGRPGAQPL